MPRIGEKLNIYPTHILGANKFYGQIGKYEVEFEQFQSELQRVDLKRVDCNDIVGNDNNCLNDKCFFLTNVFQSEDDFYLAKYTDGFIYRIRLLSVNSNGLFEVIGKHSK